MEDFERKLKLEQILGKKVFQIKRLKGGRNSQVFKIILANSEVFFSKFYHRHPNDKRERRKVEFSSFQFLREHGVSQVPQPVASDANSECAIYEYIDGKEFEDDNITIEDINQAVRFILQLKKLSLPTLKSLPYASEACFSFQSISEVIQWRLQRLQNVADDFPDLSRFLENDFIPTSQKIHAWGLEKSFSIQVPWQKETSYADRILSPSDFGFHNALKLENGTIIFIDFEYFGWDDPVKLLSDFLLHPAKNICRKLRIQFAAEVLAALPRIEVTEKRLRVAYPLHGLNWSLRLLNEFIIHHMQRRNFASKGQVEVSGLQTRQLLKAKRMLYDIKEDYEQFAVSV